MSWDCSLEDYDRREGFRDSVKVYHNRCGGQVYPWASGEPPPCECPNHPVREALREHESGL